MVNRDTLSLIKRLSYVAGISNFIKRSFVETTENAPVDNDLNDFNNAASTFSPATTSSPTLSSSS